MSSPFQVSLSFGGGDEREVTVPELGTVQYLIDQGIIARGATVMLNGIAASPQAQLREGDELEVVPKSGKQGRRALCNVG